MGFHQWDVLVRGGMKDRVDGISTNDVIHSPGIPDVSDLSHEVQMRRLFPQFPIQPEELAFSLIDDHKYARLESRKLAAKLGADGAGSPRHQHRAARQLPPNFAQLECDRLSPEKVRHTQSLRGHYSEFSADQLAQSRDHAHRHSGRGAFVHRPADLLPRRRRHREHDLRQRRFAVPVHLPNVGRIIPGAQYRQCHQARALLVQVVVEKAEDRITQQGIGAHLPGQCDTGDAGAIDDQPLRALRRHRRALHLLLQPPGEEQPRGQQETNDGVEEVDRAGKFRSDHQ